jgi:hypothetical protein
MKKYITTVLFIICSSLNFIMAQTATEKKPSPQWWLNSSLADTTDQYLFHVEGQFSYTKMTGAIEGEMQSGDVRVAIRKNIFTHQTEYMIDKMNLMLESFGMNYSSESQTFTDYLDVDITRLLYSEGGFIWERDNSLLIKNRYSLYVGAGLNGLIFEQHYLKILVALGRIDQDHSIPVDDIDVVKGVYAAFYVRQHYKYVIDQRFSFMEQSYFLTNMNRSDRYRMSVSLNFSIGIIQPVSLIFGYTYKYDKESELLGAIAKNTTQTIGINVSF